MDVALVVVLADQVVVDVDQAVEADQVVVYIDRAVNADQVGVDVALVVVLADQAVACVDQSVSKADQVFVNVARTEEAGEDVLEAAAHEDVAGLEVVGAPSGAEGDALQERQVMLQEEDAGGLQVDDVVGEPDILPTHPTLIVHCFVHHIPFLSIPYHYSHCRTCDDTDESCTVCMILSLFLCNKSRSPLKNKTTYKTIVSMQHY